MQRGSGGGGRVRQVADAEGRLVELCTANLSRFQKIKPDDGPDHPPAFSDANGAPCQSITPAAPFLPPQSSTPPLRQTTAAPGQSFRPYPS